MDVGPRNLEEKIEATTRVSLVMNNGIEHWLVVCGINLPPSLGPEVLGIGPLKDIEPIKALDCLPIGNTRGQTGKVVGPCLRAW